MTTAGLRLPFGLSAMSVTLCLVIAAEVAGDHDTGSRYPVAPRSVGGGGASLVGAPAAPGRQDGWLNEILARPLFSPDRRPIEKAGVRGLPRLTGIVVAGSQRFAIFAASPNGRPIVAQAGAHVGAYEVRTVADEGVTVAGPQGTTLIRPIFDVSRPPGPAAVRTPAISPPQSPPAQHQARQGSFRLP